MSRDQSPGARRYRRAIIAVFAPLLAVALVAATLNVVSPLRLTGESVTPEALVAYSGQSIVLDTNRQLDEFSPTDVTIEPAVPVTLRAAGDKVAVDFGERLQYDTEYTVSVDATARTGGSTRLTTTFRTPPAHAYLLRQGAEGEIDEILRATVGSDELESVYTTEDIVEYDVAGSTLAIARSTGTAAGELEIVTLGEDHGRQLALPAPGTISDLALSSDGATVGYLFTSAASESIRRVRALVVQSLAEDAEPQFVEDLESEVPSVEQWSFIPQRADVIAHLMTGDIIVANPLAARDTAPLGRASVFYGTSDDVRRTAIATDDGVLSYLDLVDGSVRPAPSAPGGADARTHLARLDVVPDSDLLVEQRSVFEDGSAQAIQIVQELGETGLVRPIFNAAEAGVSLVTTSLSPNGQLIAVEVAPAMTLVIDRLSAEVVATWDAMGVVW